MAKRLNVSPASLYAYLNGTTLPRSAVFERLLHELGVAGTEFGRLSTMRDTAEVSRRLKTSVRLREAEASGVLPSPRQLPPRARHFVGRSVELALLADLGESARNIPPTGICVIHGTAGIGKTTLATWWAHRVKGGFPDGHLYVDLRGFDTGAPLDTGEALLGFLYALGAPLSDVPPTLDAKAALYRSLLDGRRVLVVLDNARSAERVRPLLPSAPGCLVVVTSRDRMDGLVIREGAARVSLDVMPHDDAVELLAGRLPAHRLADEPAVVRELVDLCAALPLALSLVASRVADRPAEPISTFVLELRDVEGRLDHFSSPDAGLDVQAVFEWSYAVLSPAAALLFRLLGLHPGPDVDLSSCAALTGGPEPPGRAVRELVHANMLVEQPTGRFRFHDLLRAYSLARGLSDDADVDRTNAVRRLLDHYLRIASLANARIQPNDVEDSGFEGVVPNGTGPELDTYAQAMNWFTAECAALRRLVQHAAEHGFESHAWTLAWKCMVFLRRTGRHTNRVAVQRDAVKAARRVADPAAEAKSLRLLADALARSRQEEEVLPLLDEALAILQAFGDEEGLVRTHLSFARALDAVGDHTSALEHAELALRSAEADGDRLILADALAATGRQLSRLARPEDALPLCERALDLYSIAGHLEGEASVLKVIGDSELQVGHLKGAIATYRQSLVLDRLLGDRYWEAHGLARLAIAHRRTGDEETGERLRSEAIAMLESMHHPDSVVLRANGACGHDAMRDGT